MESDQRSSLRTMLPRMQKHHELIESLHDEWSDYDDGASLSEIEKAFREIDLIYAEADDTAKLIDAGSKSYDDA